MWRVQTLLWSDWVSTCAVTSRNNRKNVVSGVLCESAPRLYGDRSSSIQRVSAMKFRVRFRGVNQRATKAEDPLPGNFSWKHCRGIGIVECCYQVKINEIRLRRLSVEWSVVWKLAIVLQLFLVTTCKWTINLFTNPNPVWSHWYTWQY
jgi:hypothetical protein